MVNHPDSYTSTLGPHPSKPKSFARARTPLPASPTSGKPVHSSTTRKAPAAKPSPEPNADNLSGWHPDNFFMHLATSASEPIDRETDEAFDNDSNEEEDFPPPTRPSAHLGHRARRHSHPADVASTPHNLQATNTSAPTPVSPETHTSTDPKLAVFTSHSFPPLSRPPTPPYTPSTIPGTRRVHVHWDNAEEEETTAAPTRRVIVEGQIARDDDFVFGWVLHYEAWVPGMGPRPCPEDENEHRESWVFCGAAQDWSWR